MFIDCSLASCVAGGFLFLLTQKYCQKLPAATCLILFFVWQRLKDSAWHKYCTLSRDLPLQALLPYGNSQAFTYQKCRPGYMRSVFKEFLLGSRKDWQVVPGRRLHTGAPPATHLCTTAIGKRPLTQVRSPSCNVWIPIQFVQSRQMSLNPYKKCRRCFLGCNAVIPTLSAIGHF